MKLFSITLASSLLLAIASTAGVSGARNHQAALSDAFVMPEITTQLAEAEEAVGTVLKPVLIASWISVATSSTSDSPVDSTDISTGARAQAVTTITRPTETKPTMPKATPKTPTPIAKRSLVNAPEKSGYSLAEVRTQIHSRTNNARANNNVASLSSDSALASIAQKRSEEMAAQNYFSHISPSGCDLACRFEGMSYVVYGENLAEYYEFDSLTEPELAATFISMWLKSTGHRRNLLSSDYTREGVGVAMKGGRIVVTVIFAAE